ncbi:EAL domain-containing protein [Bradyrhizobium neotropicale]|uniref:EAL domain-containing protein n=1 Tax=Bradyrhizobium neotropicale TaxID=1497615 RepID=UPI001AD6227B|nr:EAL domain-containing protein [Bradyrhizobium neotropicale]MBO4224174.1 EAL domain-containing protein [Bradyrhizobium neotropicale]
MMRRWPYLARSALVAASVAAFAAGGHFVATTAIETQQARQLEELANIALRRSEVAVDFSVATLNDVMQRGPMTCDAASLQAVRLKVYQRSQVKDIRLVNREGSVICSAYSETLEFDNEWVTRPRMLQTADHSLLLFRVDQINGVALGVLKDIDAQTSLVAILGVSAILFDILPTELRDHGEVMAQLDNGADIGRFAASQVFDATDAVTFSSASQRYPLRALVRIAPDALRRWNRDGYWPSMLLAGVLGLAFGLLLTRAVARLEGPIADIDRGLARHEFKPYFQPTFHLRTGTIGGCEVLARWVHRDGSVTPPMNFIPLAESSGRIEAITWQILALALKEMRPRLAADKYFKMSVNITPRHLLSEGFVERLRREVMDNSVSARQIVIEVTEREAFPDLEKAAAVIEALREHGFKVAMDDVGVGHSGLSQIKRLGINIMKIDKFFVDTIVQDGSAATIVEMLVRLAAKLRMNVIAEGIETAEQRQALLGCGVECGQGYLVSPPLPFAKFDEFLAAYEAKAEVDAVVRQASVA